MDEADKYKQRLEAIAEKRRLQEEQDRARREMEDEKLRLQQLKRKSLRDQWLMEGPPLSPTTPDAQTPRSPAWGSQAQEIEQRIDNLQLESQRLAEEEEKLLEQMDDGQMEAVKVGEDGEDIAAAAAAVQNGENSAVGLETSENEVNSNQSPLVEDAAAILINGRQDFDADMDPDTCPQSNGPVPAEDVSSKKLDPSLAVDEEESSPAPNVGSNEQEEEEEGTLVMRAECVMIVDEGDDAPEDLTPREDQQNTVQPEEAPQLDPEADQEEGKVEEEVLKAEAVPETCTQMDEEDAAAEPAAETHPETAAEVTQANDGRDGETEAEGQDKQDGILEETAVASVPVYSHATLTPEMTVENAAAASPEGAEVAAEAHDTATAPGTFQEVPLTDPRGSERTEPKEEEPLLSQTKAPDSMVEQPAAPSPASTETQTPSRAHECDTMFPVSFAIALLFLVTGSHSAPLDCNSRVQPLDQLDLDQLVGRYLVVAGSLQHARAADAVKKRDSIAVDFSNSSYTQVNRQDGQCQYWHNDFTVEGNVYTMKRGDFNFTVTFFNTSCPDCLLLTMDIMGPSFTSKELYLISRRRLLIEKEMQEFEAVVECLKMPSPVVLNPTGELCPEQTEYNQSAAETKEKAEEQEA
ncbi:uncharacterized protein V6R79_000649 [Siganus canaliculatus]